MLRIALIVVVLGFAFSIIREFYSFRKAAATVEPAVAEEIELQSIYSGVIHPNGTLYGELLTQEVPAVVAAHVTERFSEIYDLTNSHPGDGFKLFLTPDDDILAFEYVTNDMKKYGLDNIDGKLVSRVGEVELEKRIEYIGVTIESSLWDAVVRQLPETELFSRITDIYAWEIDFLTDTRGGDTFKMLYEALYRDGKFVKCGDILAAEYDLGGTKYRAFLYTDPDGRTDYYDENGYSLRLELLKSPLNYRRISSGFSRRRLHPVSKIFRPHLGVDYAARIGTPIVAAGEGIIKTKGWVNGFGNYIEIEHDFGLTTGYGHLRNFATGIKLNRRVRQGQVIGYVGQTGIATGPHLDYRVRKDGRYINPLKMTVPASPPIKSEFLKEFKGLVADRLRRLQQPVEPSMLVSDPKTTLLQNSAN